MTRPDAVRIGLEPVGSKNLEVFSPTIGRQLLELGLIDEIDLHIAPILLGEGIRLYNNPGSEPIRLRRFGEGDSTAAVNVRYRPAPTAKIPTKAATEIAARPRKASPHLIDCQTRTPGHSIGIDTRVAGPTHSSSDVLQRRSRRRRIEPRSDTCRTIMR